MTKSWISIPLRGRERKLKLIPNKPKINGNNPATHAEQTPVANPPIVPKVANIPCFFTLFFSLYFM